MNRTSNLLSSGFVSLMCTLMWACGGGGGDSYDADTGMVEPEYRLARFEFERGSCAFDSAAARELASQQYPLEYAQCGLVFIGNTLNGQPWPASSWPSSPQVQ
ncbi:MAG: hypothetical protein KIT35_21920 [Piscinibacter sp.]|uniref:hypothetical protein n=1 Tax=Piscinibacter sp. TaxID=1903157 RepID=UPI002583F964|nr:hypothetical protein [Piscinibacter sp.]MCW5666498.1 hypothetical protein [Piscinibacter sp.]